MSNAEANSFVEAKSTYGPTLITVQASEDQATFKYFRIYMFETTDNFLASGNYTSQIWNAFGVKNDPDGNGSSLGSLIYEASASQILEIWWENQAFWNDTYVRWTFPEDFRLEEGRQIFRGFMTGYVDKDFPLSVTRSVNRSVFSGTGYQLVNVRVSFEDTNFYWAGLNVNLWDSDTIHPEILNDSFVTDAPISYLEISSKHIHVEVNKSEVQPGKYYNFSFVIKVNLLGDYTVEYLPRIEAEYGLNLTDVELGSGYSVEFPQNLLPDDVYYLRVYTDVNNTWKAQKGEICILALACKMDVLSPLAKFRYWRIYEASGDNAVIAGVHNTSIWNSISIWNYPELSREEITNLRFEAFADKILDVWKSDRATWNSTHAVWDLSDRTLVENGVEGVGFKTGYKIEYIPINLERKFNRTIFYESGFQEVYINFSIENGFDWVHITVYPAQSDRIQTMIVDYEKDFQARYEALEESLELEMSPSQIEANRTYHLKVTIYVENPLGIPYSVKPYIHVEACYGYDETYHGNTNSPELSPGYSDVNLVGASISENNYFWIGNGTLKRATLKSEVALPFSTVKVEYYPAEIHTADSDVFHPGFYSTVNYSHFEVRNVRDKTGEPLEGFEVNLNLKKPVISVYGDRMGVVSDSAVYWNFWDMVLNEDYGTYFGVLTEGVEKFMPFEINRTVNRTKFSSDSYQIVNVAFRYQNTSGDTCYIRLKANDEMTLRPEIVDVLYTDFPSSKWFFVGSHDLSIGCSCDEVVEGEEYHLTALVRVKFVKSTEHEAVFKPEFRIYRITNVNKSFYRNTSQLIWDLNLGDASRIEIDTSANYSWMLQTAPIESVRLEQVYDIIFNGMYLFSEDYWLSHPDQDRTIWMIRAVSDTTEVGYDDGNMDGSWSIGRRGVDHGRGSAMLFEVTPPFKLTAVKVYGKYYCNNTQDFCSALLENQTFIVFVLDSKMNLIKMKEFKYTDYFTENFSWVTIPLDVTINDTEFYILIDTNSSAPYADWCSGIRIAYDERSSPEEVRSYVFNWVKFEKPVRGDLDGDGNVTINDVTMVAYMITGKMKSDLGADFNNNGRIDIGDLAKIAYYIVGKAKL